MSKRTVSDEHKLIFLCTRLEINKSHQQEIKELLNNSINWNKIIKISTRHQILPFLYYTLYKLKLQNIIPQDILALMKKFYYLNLKRNLNFEKEIFLILKLANCKGISVIPFKGFALIQTLYCNPALRIMVDVDILIKEDEFREIRDILTQLNYQVDAEDIITSFTKIISPNINLVIEIHRALTRHRPYKITLPYLWGRTQHTTINNQRLLCLSEEDTFLSLALHLRKHTRTLMLKFIVDIAELLNIYRDKFDWNYIKKSAKNNRIIIPVYLSLYLTKELLVADVSSEILNEFLPNIIKAALIRITINKYNFFTFKRWQGTFLRLLLFDSLIDFIIYLWRVSLFERLINKQRLRKTKVNVTNKIPISPSDKIKK